MKTNFGFRPQYFYLWGMFWGTGSAILGSVIYTVLSLVDIILKFGLRAYLEDFEFGFIIFGYVVALSIVPGGIGGWILAYLIRRGVQKSIFTKNKAINMGVLIGMLLGFGLWCMAMLVALGSAHIPLRFAFTEGVKGVVLSTLAGWLVAAMLVKKIEKQT